VFDADVGQSEVTDRGPPHLHLALGKVHADKLALRQERGQGDEVSSAGAAHFQDTATRHRGGVHPEDPSKGGKAVRVALRKGVAFIGNRIVACFGFVGGDFHGVSSFQIFLVDCARGFDEEGPFTGTRAERKAPLRLQGLVDEELPE